MNKQIKERSLRKSVSRKRSLWLSTPRSEQQEWCLRWELLAFCSTGNKNVLCETHYSSTNIQDGRQAREKQVTAIWSPMSCQISNTEHNLQRKQQLLKKARQLKYPVKLSSKRDTSGESSDNLRWKIKGPKTQKGLKKATARSCDCKQREAMLLSQESLTDPWKSIWDIYRLKYAD